MILIIIGILIFILGLRIGSNVTTEKLMHDINFAKLIIKIKDNQIKNKDAHIKQLKQGIFKLKEEDK